MMVISATGTEQVPQSAAYDDTIIGEIGQTIFEIHGPAARAVLAGETVTVTATSGGTTVPTGNITVNPDATVTLTGLPVPADTRTQTGSVTAGQTIIPIEELNILTAFDAGVTVQVLSSSFTPTGGTAAGLVPNPTIDADARAFVIRADQNTVGGTYSFQVTIPAFTTAGIPRTRPSTARRTVVISYPQISAYNEEVERIYPADRCSWDQRPSATGNGYHIVHAVFYPGGVIQNRIATTGTDTIAGTPVIDDLQDPILGYIGKSGRFVPITERT